MKKPIEKKINNKTMSLLVSSYKDKIENGYFKMDFGNDDNFYDKETKERKVSLAATNLEKICFCVGPGQFLKKNKFLFSEEYIEDKESSNKPVDFAYKVEYQGSTKYLGFLENKLLDQNLEYTVKKTVKQIFNNYIKPLKKENDNIKKKNPDQSLYFETNEERPKNFTVSICIFDANIYLKNSYNFLNYCDNREADVKSRLKDYGFVILTVFINIDAIKTEEGLQIEFNKFFNQNDMGSLSVVVPTLIVFNGYIQKDVHDSTLNTNITATFEELYKLPYYNISSNSRITNTRDIVEKNDSLDKKLNHNILQTIVKNYKRKQEKGGNQFPINLSETYRSLGAKNREISFYVPQTIVVLDQENQNIPKEQIVEKRMSQKSYYLTCNMNLIDGQHSSKHISKYLEIFEGDKKNWDNEYETIIKKVYGKNYSTFDSDAFRKFLLSHHIIISVKGFSLEDVAQQAATNQNNIRKQSKINQVTNKSREKILKLSNFYNKLEKKQKLKVNKSAWSNPELVPSEIEVINPEVLTSPFGVWSQSDNIFLKNEEINSLLGKSNTTTNSQVGNAYEKAINWFINVDSKIEDLSEKIDEIIRLYEDYNEEEDEAKSNDYKNSFVAKATKLFEIVQSKEMQEKLKEPSLEDIYSLLITAQTNFKREKYEDVLIWLEETNTKIINTSVIFENRLINALKIHIAACDYYKSKGNGKSIPLLKAMQTDNLYYVIIYLNIILFKNMIKNYPNEDDLLGHITSDDVDNGIKELDKRLKEGDGLLKGETLKELNLGNKGPMNVDLFTILIVDK